MKIITFSTNIQKSQNIKHYYLDANEIQEEIQNLKNTDKKKYVQYHKYIDKTTGECKEKVDNIYFY